MAKMYVRHRRSRMKPRLPSADAKNDDVFCKNPANQQVSPEHSLLDSPRIAKKKFLDSPVTKRRHSTQFGPVETSSLQDPTVSRLRRHGDAGWMLHLSDESLNGSSTDLYPHDRDRSRDRDMRKHHMPRPRLQRRNSDSSKHKRHRKYSQDNIAVQAMDLAATKRDSVYDTIPGDEVSANSADKTKPGLKKSGLPRISSDSNVPRQGQFQKRLAPKPRRLAEIGSEYSTSGVSSDSSSQSSTRRGSSPAILHNVQQQEPLRSCKTSPALSRSHPKPLSPLASSSMTSLQQNGSCTRPESGSSSDSRSSTDENNNTGSGGGRSRVPTPGNGEAKSRGPTSARDMPLPPTPTEEDVVLDPDIEYDFDVAKVIPKERISESESFDGFVKFLRVFTFLFLMLVILSATAVAVTSLLLLETAVMKDQMHSWNAQNQLLWILCMPHIFVFIDVTMRNIFGETVWPSKTLFFFVWVTEVLHSFGVALLVFRVLPHFGSVFALGLLNASCIVPAILKVIFTKWECDAKGLLFKLLDILAMCGQLTALVGPFLSGDNPMSTISNFNDGAVKWQTPLALFLVSIKWWENFVGENRFCLRLKSLKNNIHKSRNIISAFTSFSNIVITVASMVLLDFIYGTSSQHHHLFDPPLFDDSSDEMYEITRNETTNETTVTLIANPESNSSLRISECRGVRCAELYFENIALCLVCVGCSMLAFFCALVACKLLMQRCSFAIPLMLSSPAALGLIFMQCKDIIPTIEIGSFEYRLFCPELSTTSIVFCVVWYMSLLWLTRYIWNPRIDRLAFADRVFVTKLYCSPLLPQSLLMNRRDDFQDCKMQFEHDPEVRLEDERVKRELQAPEMDDKQWKDTKKKRVVPKIYACGTMWHETRNEMIQLLKSVMRMDIDQNARNLAEDYFKIIDPDYYEFETHIFFDDCLDIDDDEKWIPNKFVFQFVQCVSEAASSVHKEAIVLAPPTRRITPYGGTLTWHLPCGNAMVVHLKDKNKIRHRKRWSQVMYMYYLLGYRLFEEHKEDIEKRLAGDTSTLDSVSTDKKSTDDNGETKKPKVNDGFGKAEIFNEMSERKLKEAENTFILALDGDVDFKPDAVRLLVDRLKVNPKSGAACGRIHPIGSGPLVWYQEFEYAIGHWFQKAAEHVLGCVLCSPGCFSLFRGSALLDDNVMARYTAVPEEPSHYIQYDQGEDRWLCTLLLQQGYRVDYCAASDALTYAPENFNEFFNQRRRWTPSTIANIIDLLSDAKNTVNVNPNISYLYIMYQFMLMVSMILGPSTIILAIATAFQSVFSLDLWESYALSVAPVIFYIIICFKTKPATQLTVAAFLSTIYACIMTIVLVGIIQTIVTENIFNPTLLFLAVITISFVLAGFLHPYEFFCLIHGITYYLCIPAGYLVLMIYSISNLHVVSWGTREVKKRKSKRQMERDRLIEEQKKKEKMEKNGILAYLHLDAYFKEIKDTLTQLFQRSNTNGAETKSDKYMKKMYREMRKLRKGEDYESSDSESDSEEKKSDSEKNAPEKPPEVPKIEEDEEEIEILPDPLHNPNFIKHPDLGNGDLKKLNEKEWIFFRRMIKKYLEPFPKNPKKEQALKEELLALRTNCSFAFWFVNLLWYLFNFMINRDNNLNVITIAGYETQPLGFVFIIFFVLVLVLQVLGMIKHRWGTFLQLISIAELTTPIRSLGLDGKGKLTPHEAIRLVKEVSKKDTFIPDDDSSKYSHNVSEPQKIDQNRIRKNARDLVQKDRSAPEERRRHRQRGDFAINMDNDADRRHRHRRESHARLDHDLDRYSRERQHRQRSRVPYHKAFERQFDERFGQGLRYRGGGAAGSRGHGSRSGGGGGGGRRYHEDVGQRARRRLDHLARY